MGIYHAARELEFRGVWTLHHTAKDFGVSIGLVSENIRLALAIDKDKEIIKCKTRQDALKRINNGIR